MTVGDKVIYPNQGPCVIGPVVKKSVDGTLVSFYQLVPLEGGGGEVFVPIDKSQAIGIRELLKKSEIPKLLGRFKQPSGSAGNWKQRAMNNAKLFASGSAFDLAEIVESLTELSETKTLSPGDRRALDRARKLLACEISEVTGETKSAAEEHIDKALKGWKTG
jgi:RNA polymerase-interacting CarD/CdnL/TRCF family regulator